MIEDSDADMLEGVLQKCDLSKGFALLQYSQKLWRLIFKGSERKIKDLLTPEKVKTHGRPIYAQDVLNCGLNIEIRNLKEKFWSTVYEVFVRLDNFVSTNNVAKCIESKDYSFRAKAEG